MLLLVSIGTGCSLVKGVIGCQTALAAVPGAYVHDSDVH